MIRALQLLFNPPGTWEKIRNDQHAVGRISTSFLLPLLLLTGVVEYAGLVRLGTYRGVLLDKLATVPEALALRYELAEVTSSLVIVYLGAVALQRIGAAFHRRHSYTECFTTLAYSLSPLFLLRMLDAVPAINTWICFAVGIVLSLSILYSGVPLILRPDPSNAFGLFLVCSLLLLVATGLAHLLAVLVLEERMLSSW